MIEASLIIARAKNLGFSFTGFANVEQKPHFQQYISCIADIDLGDLQFLQKDYVKNGRKNPASLLKNAQSIIVLGAAYQPEKHTKNCENGIISAYAQYQDYHQVLRDRAERLISAIKPGFDENLETRIFIDSGPLMEKDVFFSAGLGWIGKHSIAIHPSFGSYFFICCIMLNTPIKFQTTRIEDMCGDCEICRNACPTGCIQNHTIDATRCISYLTIEHKGIIPRELRKAIGARVFGCDLCQEVCPLNKHISIPQKDIFFGNSKLIPSTINLMEEISFDETQFRAKYKRTPVSRLSLIQFKRNILTAMGNIKKPAFFSTALNYLSHPSSVLRCHAVWALSQIDRMQAQTILEKHLEMETDPDVIAEIRQLL